MSAALAKKPRSEVTDLMIDAALDAWFVDTLGDPRTPAWLVGSVKDGHWERMRGALTAAMEAEG